MGVPLETQAFSDEARLRRGRAGSMRGDACTRLRSSSGEETRKWVHVSLDVRFNSCQCVARITLKHPLRPSSCDGLKLGVALD